MERTILYTTMWLGGIQSVTWADRISADLAAQNIGIAAWRWWVMLLLIGPVMAAAAGVLRRFYGRAKVWSMWLRLGADLSMLVAMLVFGLTILRVILGGTTPAGGSAFALIVLAGVVVLIGVWTVRDIAALVKMERVATDLRAR